MLLRHPPLEVWKTIVPPLDVNRHTLYSISIYLRIYYSTSALYSFKYGNIISQTLVLTLSNNGCYEHHTSEFSCSVVITLLPVSFNLPAILRGMASQSLEEWHRMAHIVKILYFICYNRWLLLVFNRYWHLQQIFGMMSNDAEHEL